MEDYILEDEKEDSANCIVHYCCKIADIPQTYEEAISSEESRQWKMAMKEEIKALEDNNTYELTPIPEGRSVVGGKWVYTVKNSPGSGENFKARYVAKGYSQVQGIDFQETFSPTAKLTSIRMLMQLAVQGNMIVNQMDVKTAYLNADLDCEIFLEQPKGFVKTDKNGEELVCKLKKSLYGLKQSGRNWNNLLHKCLVEENFVQSQADYCVYTKFEGGSTTIIIFWVDDIIIAASNSLALNRVKKYLSDKFKMKDIGKLAWFLGIEFVFEGDCIRMNQRMYCEKLLKRFNMTDCKPKSIPCDPGIVKMIGDDSKEMVDPKLYREIVGSLIL